MQQKTEELKWQLPVNSQEIILFKLFESVFKEELNSAI
jgi:hypothetical protein